MHKSRQILLLIGLSLILILSSCSPANNQLELAVPINSGNSVSDQNLENKDIPSVETNPEPEAIVNPTSLPTDIPNEPTQTAHPDWTATPDLRLLPHQWRSWPVVPEISEFSKKLYLSGIAMGNDPSNFSKIGDCQSQPEVFFGIYDTPGKFNLNANNQYLQITLDQYQGSFSRDSVAVANGMSVASEFSPLWAHNSACQGAETPMQCENRLHNPSIAIISLGTNWPSGALEAFENNLRKIVAYTIAAGGLPLLTTKADFANEGDLINQTMAAIAYEFDIPLWNFWRTVQHLPNQGIDPVESGGSIYLVPAAWDIKSFSGLEILDLVWSTLNDQVPH